MKVFRGVWSWLFVLHIFCDVLSMLDGFLLQDSTTNKSTAANVSNVTTSDITTTNTTHHVNSTAVMSTQTTTPTTTVIYRCMVRDNCFWKKRCVSGCVVCVRYDPVNKGICACQPELYSGGCPLVVYNFTTLPPPTTTSNITVPSTTRGPVYNCTVIDQCMYRLRRCYDCAVCVHYDHAAHGICECHPSTLPSRACPFVVYKTTKPGKVTRPAVAIATTTQPTVFTPSSTSSTSAMTTLAQNLSTAVPPPCDKPAIDTLLLQPSQVQHIYAGQCSDLSHTEGDALPIKYCHLPRKASWKPGLKVVDHCRDIPPYSPIGVFLGGNTPTHMSGVLLSCGNHAFTVAQQTCQNPPAKVTLQYHAAGSLELSQMYYQIKS